MPVRKIKSSGGKITGKFPSLKMNKMLPYESTLERDYLFLLDYEADVTYIEVQPQTLHYQHNDRMRRYTPDVHIVLAGQNILVECKPAARVNDESNQPKFAAGRAYCAEHGWSFRVVTDHQVRAGYRLRNIKMLRQYACHVIRPEFKGWIYVLLQNTPMPPTLAQIQTVASIPPAEVWAGLLHMAYHHEIVIPLEDAMISTLSPVGLPGAVTLGGQS